MRRAVPLWYTILQAARKVGKAGKGYAGGSITSQTLSQEAGIAPHTASSWLGKLCRWGYAFRAGSQPLGGRWCRVYELTPYGASRPAPKGTRPYRAPK